MERKKRETYIADVEDIANNAKNELVYTFAVTLNKLMFERGIDGEQMALDLGISKGAVSNYRKAIQEPKLVTILKMAKYLGVDCHYLMTGISAENRTVCEELGLSDKGIKRLSGKNLSEQEKTAVEMILTGNYNALAAVSIDGVAISLTSGIDQPPQSEG